MAENNQPNQPNQPHQPQRADQDQTRMGQQTPGQPDVGSSIGVQGEEASWQAGSQVGDMGGHGDMSQTAGEEGSQMDDEESEATSATLQNQGGQGGGVENADFVSSGGAREQNLGGSDQADTGAQREGGIQQDRS